MGQSASPTSFLSSGFVGIFTFFFTAGLATVFLSFFTVGFGVLLVVSILVA